jgi:hypothetical protein
MILHQCRTNVKNALNLSELKKNEFEFHTCELSVPLGYGSLPDEGAGALDEQPMLVC